ncbi:uncharacterized protein LOC130677170 [Microplitis mediator]|uniref:uncharacterized protein LOC130677170 n=1 Tax=Microplitis mediator TaxID=375433 RepID=UPI0025532D02|nr:uncharacterized protein LOC130677170 [Microplitis mediator]
MGRHCSLGSYPVLQNHCYCDDNSDPILSVRKVSLLLQTCNTAINEVVTDTRFHVQDGIISIEVQCGTFYNGKIYPNTVRWNTDDRRYTRGNHPNHVVLSATLRSFNLDDILLPDGEFVTGVKLERFTDNHLVLAIQGTQMYDSNNRIISGQTTLRYPQSTGYTRVNINVYQLPAPQDLNIQTYEMSQSGYHYIDLITSKWSDKYTGNAVMPFLDMQPVNLSPPVPLGRLGLFYKSQPGYGGFLAFKHISPKFMHFISEYYVYKLTTASPA